jgi:hypothetical protein
MTAARPVAVLVLGASGRVGRELLPLVAECATTVAAVGGLGPSRTWGGLRWIQFDVTERSGWRRSLQTLSEISGDHWRTVVVDLVLNRATVSGMRQSIADVTDYARTLLGIVSREDSTACLVIASTTAVLAPWIYQTPYGLAKRRQAEEHATLRGSQIILLPSLAAAPASSSSGWSYRTAALRIASVVHDAAKSPSLPAAALWVPDALPVLLEDTPLRGRVLEAAAAHLRCLATRPDDPSEHRRAARSRLNLTPLALRGRVDHHLAPEHLVAAFARRIGVHVEYFTAFPNVPQDGARHG